MSDASRTYSVTALTGIGEVVAGDDLAALVATATDLADGDVLVVTSKVVSKAEGRQVRATKEEALGWESDRLVARRGPTSIVRTRHGLVMAGAGIDASNTEVGTLVLLPLDPDGSARRLRAALRETTGRNVAVVVSDTSGRAWRDGQTDIAIGAAGLVVLDDHAGRTDAYGNELAVTAPALADEVAAAGDLAKGKLAGRPVALVRGLADLVLPAGEDGPGAARLVRAEEGDMFGLGAREAVLVALLPGTGLDAARGFGAAAPRDALGLVLLHGLQGLADVRGVEDHLVVGLPGDQHDRLVGALELSVSAVAVAHGWYVAEDESDDLTLVCRPRPRAEPPRG